MAMPVYVFDAYGTLFDVHAAVARHSDEIGPQAARLSELWRMKQLEYTWVRSLAEAPYIDFRELTAQALDTAAALTTATTTTAAAASPAQLFLWLLSLRRRRCRGGYGSGGG